MTRTYIRTINNDGGASLSDGRDDKILAASDFITQALQCAMLLDALFVLCEIGKAVLHG